MKLWTLDGRKMRNSSWAILTACVTFALLAAPANAGIVSLWQFGDPANPGFDSGPEANHLTPINDAHASGGVAHFDGNNDYFGVSAGDQINNGSVPNTAAYRHADNGITGIPIGDASYSMSAQINPDSNKDSGIVGWGNNGTAGEWNNFQTSNGGGSLANQWWGADITKWFEGAGATKPGDIGSLSHVAVTYDQATNTRNVYAQGILLGTDNPSKTGIRKDHGLRIGRNHGNSTGQAFKGTMDDVAIFNHALSASEVATIAGGDFSQYIIPEPSSLALAFLAIAGLFAARRSQRS